jgi:mannose-6-phosphate isomerase-like protein (cupin superfamily)
MTAGIVEAVRVGAAPRVPPPAAYGVITSDTAGMGTVRNLVGGQGEASWKQVINGMHLPGGGWGCVEVVDLSPGSSCGEHLHATREEIYVITAGQAIMRVNGDEIAVSEGDLITCPLGTVHGIGVPAGADQVTRLLVIEAAPGTSRPPASAVRISLPATLGPCQGYRGGGEGQETRVAVADLTRHLSGNWQRCSLIEIPPGENLGPYRLPVAVAEVLFVATGSAQITAAGVESAGGEGLTVGTSLGAEILVRNLSPDRPLTVLSTEVRA